MTYEKLGLVDGDTLKAEHIDHIEDGIYNNDGAISSIEDELGSETESGTINYKIKTLQDDMTSAQEDITAVENDISSIDGDIQDIQAELDNYTHETWTFTVDGEDEPVTKEVMIFDDSV